MGRCKEKCFICCSIFARGECFQCNLFILLNDYNIGVDHNIYVDFLSCHVQV